MPTYVYCVSWKHRYNFQTTLNIGFATPKLSDLINQQNDGESQQLYTPLASPSLLWHTVHSSHFNKTAVCVFTSSFPVQHKLEEKKKLEKQPECKWQLVRIRENVCSFFLWPNLTFTHRTIQCDGATNSICWQAIGFCCIVSGKGKGPNDWTANQDTCLQ
jgi:hypothetical protein